MRIASKINAALLGALACGSVVTFAVLETTIQPRFDEIERAQAKMNHNRVMDAIHTFTEKLRTAAQDYAFWDETYQFVQGENVEDFVKSNLEPEFKAVENLGINALIFMRADGSVQWGSAYDLETEEPIAGMVEELASLGRDVQFTINSETDEPASLRGLVNTSKGLFLVAVSPALKSDRSGPAMGKVISGKFLNVASVKEVTSVDFEIEPLKAGAKPEQNVTDIKIATLDGRVETLSVEPDAFGTPLVTVKAFSPRDVSRTGVAAVRSALLMMVAGGLVALGVLWMFLRHSVVQRIEALKSHFATAGTSGMIKQTSVDDRKDEIADLASSFNSMAGQVNHLRDALADSAYMSGLSEWAASTLHNVRNGLAPVTATTWQLDQLFDDAWLKKISMAATQFKDENTPHERRQKVAEFLAASASQFADAGQRAHNYTHAIQNASKSVLDMVSEFERYSQRTIESDAVELLPVLKAAAAIARESNPGVEITMPETPVAVFGNAITLRQIMSNILSCSLGAIEAAKNPSQNGRIEILLSQPSDSSSTARLEITDNGIGYSQEDLALVFKRGSISARTQGAGLGLHWCANAIKVLDGTIEVTSEGPGRGSTIIIEIPTAIRDQKKAA